MCEKKPNRNDNKRKLTAGDKGKISRAENGMIELSALQRKIYGRASKCDSAAEAIVVTANRLRVAGVPAKAKSVDGTARNSNRGVKVVQDNTKDRECVRSVL